MVRQKRQPAKTYPVRVSVNALQNVDEITGYIAFVALQPLNAAKVGDKLVGSFDRIAAFPHAFKECRYIPTKTKIYRQVKCLSWYIIYKITPAEVIILGIIHASRRPAVIKALRKVR